MRRYYKHEAESEFGTGAVYIEFSGEWPTRQVEVYGEHWRWGSVEFPEFLADQPLEVLQLNEEHEITQRAFEQIWLEAMRQCPPHS